MASMIPGANAPSAPRLRSARPGTCAQRLTIFCLLLATLSALCSRRALGQTITWDLIADWNGRNPIDNFWSLSGGPTPYRWHGFESFGGDFSNFGCPHSFIVKCIGAPTTQECAGSPTQVSLNTGEVAWHPYSQITWTADNFCGPITINAVFQDHPGQRGITDLIVTKNGTELWRNRLNGGTAAYAQTVAVLRGDKIVFKIDLGPDGLAEDTVKITLMKITGTPQELPLSTWTGTTGDGEWDSAGNWSPSGRPADNAGAAFNLAAPSTVRVPAGRKVGGIGAYAGTLNLVVSDGTLSSPTDQCLPIGGSLLIGDTGATAGFSLFGGMLCDRVAAVGFGNNCVATLAVDTYGTLRTQSGLVVAYASGSTGIINVDARGRLLQTSGPSISLARGDDSFGTINLTNGGTLQYSAATPLKVGNGPGAQGTINLTGSFEGVSSLIPSSSNSQILLGAESPPPGGATTLGTINLHDRGLVRATEIRLGSEPRTRGTITMDGGTLDVESLIIADKGDGSLDWSAGSITGLRQITIGNGTGNSGRLDLDGPGRSLTLATPIGGETQNLYAGKTGRGRIFVTNGASINLSSASLGGLSIGATDPSGAGGVQIVGHEPDNPYFRSRIVGNAGSVLNVGRTYTVPLSIPALLLDDGARATFGSVYVGRENWMDGEIHVRNRALLEQIRPGANAFGSNDGLQIRGTPAGARLLVDSGGQVQCTSGIAFNTYLGDPVIKVTGGGSTLDCSGAFYVAGDLPVGGKMRVENGARMTSRDVFIARGGGVGLPGELTLSGPGEVLNVSGTLTVGVEGEPTAAGRLVLLNGAKVRTHRLALGDNTFITNGSVNNPQIMVGGSPFLAPDIQCDTLIVSETFDVPGLDVAFGPGGGIGGHGTWTGPFDSLGEIVVPDAVIYNGQSPMPRLTIDGNLVQHPSSVLEVAQTGALWVYGDFSAPIGSFLQVNGAASIAGTLRLTLWTIPMSVRNSGLWPSNLIGTTLPVLAAASVTGTFNAVEFGPGFPTNRVQLTYEPTQVLVTFLPPVCETTIQTQPADQTACTESSASFVVSTSGADELSSRVSYQWQHFVYDFDDTPHWFPMGDGFNYHFGGNLYTAEGAGTANLSLVIDPAFFYRSGNTNVPIRCVVTNVCGEIIESDPATLAVHTAPAITVQPANTVACLDSPATFTIASSGPAPIAYRWQWQPAGDEDEWSDLIAGDNASAAGPLINASNVTTATLEIRPLPASLTVTPRSFRCILTNPCGSVTSNAAALTVENCTPCPADFNQDGGIDGADVGAFFSAWEAGDPSADVNADGGVDGADVTTFFAAWEAGGCG
ncbi:MAG: hypothetical protein JSR77_14635 [Planctomycetes bacterium]|nr:hypothetical protein [Planctomycetota bacterium]